MISQFQEEENLRVSKITRLSTVRGSAFPVSLNEGILSAKIKSKHKTKVRSRGNGVGHGKGRL